MAFMRPDTNPDDIPYDSERLTFIALRDQLPDDYVVLHSYPWLRPGREGELREGEADFVIIHRERGMLVLEVKGGKMLYQHGKWVRINGAQRKQITDPFTQARKSMHTLVERIEEFTGGDVLRDHFSYGYAVVFPHDKYTGPLPAGSDPVIIITHSEMGDLHSAIVSAFEKWPTREEPLSKFQWNRFIAALLPEFKLFQPVSATAGLVAEQIQELTSEQLEVLRGVYEDNDRVYVTGVAGSGKTQIALDRAVSLAMSGVKTLFVCFNVHLAVHLEKTVFANPDYAGLKKLLHIRHFHRLGEELAADAEVAWNAPEEEPAKSKFYEEQAPALMEQAAFLQIEEGASVQYQAIVVDEAQDFHSQWWELLNNTLLKEPETGSFYAFGDPVQRFWDWAAEQPPIAFDTRITLRRNCRNSRWIAKVSQKIASTQAGFYRRSPTGGRPMIDEVPTMAGMKGAVFAAVRKLIDQHELKPSQIVLIGPNGLKKGSLAGSSDIDGVELTASTAKWFAGDGILVTTSRSFKGLEADAVVIYDLQATSKIFTLIDLYVACTRAQTHVHFLVAGKELAQVVKQAVTDAGLEIQ